MNKKDKKLWESIQFPIVKNVSPRTLAQDIKGFDPNNPRDVKEWGDMFKKMWSKIKKDFDEKGIPMPNVVIDYSKEPISYGIKTTDENGNILHQQP